MAFVTVWKCIILFCSLLKSSGESTRISMTARCRRRLRYCVQISIHSLTHICGNGWKHKGKLCCFIVIFCSLAFYVFAVNLSTQSTIASMTKFGIPEAHNVSHICSECLTSQNASSAYGVHNLQETGTFSPTVNSNGTFIPRLGYTIVSATDHQENWGVEDLFRKSLVLKNIVSPLPEDSYHVTISKLYSHGEKFILQRNWLPDEVSTDAFIPMEGTFFNSLLTGDVICDEFGSDFVARFKNIESFWGKGDALVIRVEILNDNWTSYLRRLLFGVFGYHGVLGAIRTSAFPVFDITHFHMSLGYVYKSFPSRNAEKEQLMSEVNELEKLLKDKTVQFLKPGVVVYNDMTCFTPLLDFVHVCYEDYSRILKYDRHNPDSWLLTI